MSEIDLSPQEYEAVLGYMETSNEDDYDAAVRLMRAHNFNIHNAVNSRFGEPSLQQPVRGPQNNEHREDELKQYMQFLRERRNQSVFVGIYGFIKRLIISLFSGITQIILPEFLLRKFHRSCFYNTYQSQTMTKVIDKNIFDILHSTYMSRKPIMLCIASPNGRHESLLQLLRNPAIVNKINESFYFTGTISNTPEYNKIEGEKNPPCIIIMRQNIFEKMQIVFRFIGEEQIRGITVDRLNQAIKTHQNACRSDRNIVVRYRNHLRRMYARPGIIYEEEEEEELFQDWHSSSSASEMIKFQNEEYNKVKEEAIKKEHEEQEKMRIMQEMQEERKARKMSIPDEPTEGDLVRINFRCPDGSIMTRNFAMDEKLEIVYAWVETNESIEFQDGSKRCFELLHSFPPTALCARKDELLKDVFDSDQEKVMIREL